MPGRGRSGFAGSGPPTLRGSPAKTVYVSASPTRRAHVVQKEIAKDALDAAQFWQMARGAADGLEGCLTGLDLRGDPVISRSGSDGNGRPAHVVDQQIAFVLVHVEPFSSDAGKAWISRLTMAGDFEPHFSSGGGEDEFLEPLLFVPSIRSDRLAHL